MPVTNVDARGGRPDFPQIGAVAEQFCSRCPNILHFKGNLGCILTNLSGATPMQDERTGTCIHFHPELIAAGSQSIWRFNL